MYGQSEDQREDGMSGAPWKSVISLVPEEGLEPSRGLTPPDFESGASAIPPLRHSVTEELLLITDGGSLCKREDRGSELEMQSSKFEIRCSKCRPENTGTEPLDF